VTGKKKVSEASGRSFEALRELRDALKRKEVAGALEKARPAPVSPPTSEPLVPKRAEDDAKLLRRAYVGVQPLDRSKGPRPRSPLAPSSPTDRTAATTAPGEAFGEAHARERLRALALGHTRFEVSDEGDRVEGRRTDVPLDQLRRLRRGHFPIDARLDLHGLGAEEARARVEIFLRAVRGRQERAVLVIHGKGDHSPMGLGVLRGEISAWLSQGASSKHVAAFATARESDGGPGAVYVLLRR
jgi:DNA-nicking Smr family endonuclease